MEVAATLSDSDIRPVREEKSVSGILTSMDMRSLDPGEHTAHVNGVTLHYRVAGRGPVLLMQSPGWGVGGAIYESSLTPLEADHTIVYYDPRGSGRSTRASEATLHVGSFVDDLDALRSHLGLDTMALAGHSHGGLIALHYALCHPSRVSSLVLLAAQLVGIRPHPDEENGQVDPRDAPALALAFAYLDEIGGFEAMFRATSDAEANAFLRGIAPMYFRDTRHATMLHAFLDAHAIPVRTMQAVSATDGGFPFDARALRGLHVPTLVVSGRYDLFCPPGPARTLAEALPEARRIVFEQSGHFPWVEEPEAFFAAVGRFLQRPSLLPAR